MLDRFEVYRAMWAAVAHREAENRRAGGPPLTLDEKFFWGSEAAYRLLERDVMATQVLLDDYQVPRQDADGRRLTLRQRVGHFVDAAATAPLVSASGGSAPALPTRPDQPPLTALTLLDLAPEAAQDRWDVALRRLLPDPHCPPDLASRLARFKARLAPPSPPVPAVRPVPPPLPGPAPAAATRLAAAASRRPPRRWHPAVRTVGTLFVVLLVVLVSTAAFASSHPRHGLSRWVAARAIQAGVSPHRLLLWDWPALVPAHDRILLTLPAGATSPADEAAGRAWDELAAVQRRHRERPSSLDGPAVLAAYDAYARATLTSRPPATIRALQRSLVAALRARATGWPTPDLPTAYRHLATALKWRRW